MDSAQRVLQMTGGRLGFAYQAGGVTTVTRGYSTGWRRLGCLITAVTTYEYQVRRHGLPDVKVSPGQALCLMPHTPHCIDVLGRGGISRWSHVQFELLAGVDLFQWWSLPLLLAATTGPRLGEINAALAELERPLSLPAVACRQRLGFELLELLGPQARPRPEGQGCDQQPAWAGMLARIGRDPAAPLDVPALAKMTHLSVSWFHRLFRQRIGQSPSHYLRQLRLRRAQQLLLTDNAPIKQVATQCGYNDPFTFSRAFKTYCGCSPAQFRTQARHRPL